MYQSRIKRYIPFQIEVISNLKNVKNLSEDELKIKEGEAILNKISNNDFLVLLDERGKNLTSIEFSTFIQSKMVQGMKNLVFLIGGAYGFSFAVYERSNDQLKLSSMTFSHQIIRIIFMEQLYRAFSILNNEPYHHE